MSQFTATVGKVLGNLLKSPTFAMSLGAKELFHTNFLAYLLESRDPGLGPLQESLRRLLNCPRAAGEEAWCMVYRELRSLDLLIVPVRRCPTESCDDTMLDERAYEPSGSPVSVVEAKLKALPDAEQLARYETDKLTNGIQIRWEDEEGKERRKLVCLGDKPGSLKVNLNLLTVGGTSVTPPFLQTWRGVSWASVAQAVQRFTSSPEARRISDRVREVIADYGDSLRMLLLIVEQAQNLFPLSSGRPYEDFLADITRFGELREARLVDFVGKRVFAEWAESLVHELTTLQDQLGSLVKLEAEAFLSHGVPGLFAEWQFKPAESDETSLRLGVQIQGASFRHYVAAKPNWDGLEQFTIESGLLKSWLSRTVPQLPGAPRLAASRRRGIEAPPKLERRPSQMTNLRVFNKDAFVYSDVLLKGPDATLQRATQALVASMVTGAELLVPRLGQGLAYSEHPGEREDAA